MLGIEVRSIAESLEGKAENKWRLINAEISEMTSFVEFRYGYTSEKFTFFISAFTTYHLTIEKRSQKIFGANIAAMFIVDMRCCEGSR